uniref:DZF domain-containing protein n=1 Tax=Ditylenchus dipsaci TaxID=166011 RepID=A0A915E1M2_9BILA
MIFSDIIEKEYAESFRLIQDISAASLLASLDNLQVACRITFTSVLMRNISSVLVSTSDGTASSYAAVENQWMLCRSSLVWTLWMNSNMLNTTRLSNRVKTWTPLSEWAMELLTEKALSSIRMSLGPEMLCAVFRSDSWRDSWCSGLLDPCEKEGLDVLGCLTDQNREDITASAQHALRMISFNQMFKVLSIDRLPDNSHLHAYNQGGLFNRGDVERKRAHELDEQISADGNSDAKKEKTEEVVQNL